jgi:hypothetical protein
MPAALKPFVTTLNRIPDDLSIFKKLAYMLVSGFDIATIQKELNKTIKNYRAKLCVGTPDGECKTAADRAKMPPPNGDPTAPAINYKSSTERQRKGPAPAGEEQYALVPDITIKENGVPIKPFAWYKNSAGKQVPQGFVPTYRGFCGICWLCGLPVYFYANDQFVTGCGECEHIGGIIASLFAGMLTGGMNQVMIYNYGTAHVHCNQRKNDKLSVKFDDVTGTWVVDEVGLNDIATTIYDSDNRGNDIHASEYDPEFIKRVKKAKGIPPPADAGVPPFTIDAIEQRIRARSLIWCGRANADTGLVQEISKKQQAMRIATKMNSVVKNRLKYFFTPATAQVHGGTSTSGAATVGIPLLKPTESYNYNMEQFEPGFDWSTPYDLVHYIEIPYPYDENFYDPIYENNGDYILPAGERDDLQELFDYVNSNETAKGLLFKLLKAITKDNIPPSEWSSYTEAPRVFAPATATATATATAPAPATTTATATAPATATATAPAPVHAPVVPAPRPIPSPALSPALSQAPSLLSRLLLPPRPPPVPTPAQGSTNPSLLPDGFAHANGSPVINPLHYHQPTKRLKTGAGTTRRVLKKSKNIKRKVKIIKHKTRHQKKNTKRRNRKH